MEEEGAVGDVLDLDTVEDIDVTVPIDRTWVRTEAKAAWGTWRTSVPDDGTVPVVGPTWSADLAT